MVEENQGRLSVYLQASAAKKLKLLGVEREKPVNTLVLEALSFWWSHQPDVKGPLFTDGSIETPVATKEEETKGGQSSPKASPTKSSKTKK